MNLTQKKITLTQLQKSDRLMTGELMELRAVIETLRREINEAEGILDNSSTQVKVEKNIIERAAMKSSVKSKIIGLFNEVNKPLKLKDINHRLNDESAENIQNFREVMRSMQRVKRVRLMKINNSNKLAFWVLPEWIDLINNTLYSQYQIPDMEGMKITFE